MLKTILSIAGKPGLYKLISQGKNMLIVETVDAAISHSFSSPIQRIKSSLTLG